MRLYVERAYLDYAIAVVWDRALPHIGDGLKPVQRRIVYAMSLLGLKASARYKKSARTVGDVIGKFHPHGDSAVYTAMVLMAQSFIYRYPLIDGQGNFGSPDDPKSFAAMRYTEARLTALAHAVLLHELDAHTTEWVDNFDGTLNEPTIFPARLPMVLLNGATGIAVGMATDIPPHNLREVVAGCIALLDNPHTTLSEMCRLIKAPDCPTAAEVITPASEIKQMYDKGHGSFRMRATYTMEKKRIIITALPWRTSANEVLGQIRGQMESNHLPMVTAVCDESDYTCPVRIALDVRGRKIESAAVMGHLFATTELERSYTMNMTIIGTDGRVAMKGLLTILHEWLAFRRKKMRAYLQHHLTQTTERLELVRGLIAAHLNISEVIQIIRDTAQNPKPKLMSRFQLNDAQAEGILELKLRRLAKLDEIQLREEQIALIKRSKEIERILSSKQQLNNYIKKELNDLADEYGDERCSPLKERTKAVSMKRVELSVSVEPVTVILSQQGWVFTRSKPLADCDALPYRSGDAFLTMERINGDQTIRLADAIGRVYNQRVHRLTKKREGEPVSVHISAPQGTSIVGLLNPAQDYVWASTSGFGFVVGHADLRTTNRAGKSIMKCDTGKVLPPSRLHPSSEQFVAVLNDGGRLLIFAATTLPQRKRGKGVKLMALKSEQLRACVVVGAQDSLVITTSGGRQKVLLPSQWCDFSGKRNFRGRLLPKAMRSACSLLARPANG